MNFTTDIAEALAEAIHRDRLHPDMDADGPVMDAGSGSSQFEMTGPDGFRFLVTVEGVPA
jgi:hypothetical protein